MPAFSIRIVIRLLAVWLLIIAAESLQGVLRRLLLGPEVEFAIRQGSVVIGAAVAFLITCACSRWLDLRSIRSSLAIGVVWVILTLAFEMALGRAVGLGWDRIGADYDLLHGGLMPLGLLAMGLTPCVVRGLTTGRLSLTAPPEPPSDPR